MADEKPRTVKMEALQYHTYGGEEYQVGDTYDLPEDLVDSVTLQGKAVRTDRVDAARKAAKAGEAGAKATTKGRGKRNTAVEPMGTTTKPKTPRARKAPKK